VLAPLDRLQGKEEKVPTSVSVSPPFAVQWHKAGRLITLGKIFCLSDGRLCFGTPYAGRRFCTPSLPQVVYQRLLDLGVEDWIIRFDLLGKAYRLPLADIERLATVTPDGELAVKFSYFEPCPFPRWPYATRSLLVEP
jgi:hypothetical protein